MKKLGIWMASKQGADDGVIMCRCDYQTDNLLVSSSVSGFQHTTEISPPISTYSRKKKHLHLMFLSKI